MMNENPSEFENQPIPAGTDYELRIQGRLTPLTLAWFEDMQITIDETSTPIQTVMSGPVRDQAALYGLVNRIRDLGLILISVNLIIPKEDS